LAIVGATRNHDLSGMLVGAKFTPPAP